MLAPRIIEDQASDGDPTWRKRRDNMWHFYLAEPPKPHYAALKDILSAYADDLAAQIDRDTTAAGGGRAVPGWQSRLRPATAATGYPQATEQVPASLGIQANP